MWWLVGGSVLAFVATLIVIPWLVIRLPDDYFAHARRPPAQPQESSGRMSRWVLVCVKNLAGAILLAMGITMLVLPGQGLLTILIGLSLMDFPGKYQLERYIVTRGVVLNGLNWLRAHAGVPPLKIG
ncbi:MAG: hypothetical protein HKN47_16235 [Pirellulaceae bacterium]|nr:hypothetical protein [Pirellulaceae bacterium]